MLKRFWPCSSDVRKAFGLPTQGPSKIGLRPNLIGHSPELIMKADRSAQRFRTSGGRAVSSFTFGGCGTARASNTPRTIMRSGHTYRACIKLAEFE